MLALCVDDEELLLEDLARAVSASNDINEIAKFRFSSEAIKWATENKPDIAFLDVQLRGGTGIELARDLRVIYPDLPIVFCTGYREYAFDAFQVDALGYLEKPIDSTGIQKQIDKIKVSVKPEEEKLLKIICFGNFEVLKDGKPLRFKRKRSKEVLAYLVDRRGASVTAKEICAAIWEDDDIDKNVMYLYKLIADLKSSLSEVGADEVFSRHNYDYSIAADKLDCDYYKYLAGDPDAVNSFCGEYMSQYSWAEDTAAELYDR